MFIYDRLIIRAFNPKYIYDYFHGNLKQAWVSLGGIVLCITGAEAMFADLGHFSVPSIQIGFGFIVYPCCLLAYLGQAAYLMENPGHVAHTFYKSIPEPFYWPMFSIAVAAAIIASQAMVSATFSIVKQSMALCCFPSVKVVHTSATIAGQIYVPEVNWTLMSAAIIVTAAFRSTNKLGNAYGIAVVGVMAVTTFFLALIMVLIWHTPLWMVFTFIVVFGLIDFLYFSSVLFKFEQGGYLPLAFGAALLFIMYVWHYGTTWKHEFELRHQLSESAVRDLVYPATRIPGIALVYTELADGIPCIFAHTIKNLPALHSVVVLVCVKFLPVTRVMDHERFIMRRVGSRDIHMFRCVARYGYKDVRNDSDGFEIQLLQKLKEFIVHERLSGADAECSQPVEGSRNTKVCETAESVLEQAGLRKTVLTQNSENYGQVIQKPTSNQSAKVTHASEDVNEITNTQVAGELAFIERCTDAGVVYLLGNSEVRASKSSTTLKKFLINHVYHILKRNCRRASAALIIPQERLLEVGMFYEV
ncbi:hypothetical protein KP509_29G025800 [Ceratopteris richardii]|nr:hypothetical protein KP509_29G025800 [Ceratopteris richardii]